MTALIVLVVILAVWSVALGVATVVESHMVSRQRMNL